MLYQQVNIAMAVAVEQGLITPVIRDCDQKPLAQIARESKELVARVKEGKLRQEDYEGGTFTVSNMGMFGVEEFAAIINPPQAAILAVGAMAPRPVVRDGNLAVSQTMKATLSVDHRVANGADGARYLQELNGCWRTRYGCCCRTTNSIDGCRGGSRAAPTIPSWR